MELNQSPIIFNIHIEDECVRWHNNLTVNYFAQVTSMWLLNIECSYVNVDAKHWNMVLHNKLKLRNVNVKHKAESKIWADYIKLCYIIIEPSLWIILLCLDGVVFNLVWWLCFVCRKHYSHSINARKINLRQSAATSLLTGIVTIVLLLGVLSLITLLWQTRETSLW